MTSRKTWAAPYVLAALALALLALAVLLLGGRSTAPSGVFGMQRDLVRATPGAQLTGRFVVPSGVSASDVTWRVTANGRTLASGRGSTWRFEAPGSGAAKLRARVSGTELRDETTVRTVPAASALGRDVVASGRVLVDGGRVVQGEALASGANVDATGGMISFTATARRDTGLTGRVQLEGTKLTLRTEDVAGSRVRNVIELDRSEQEQLLVADVEHLDGTRYVEVETPDAVAMVKGTRFWVRLDERGTDVAVDHGWVVVHRVDEDATEAVDVRDERSTFVPRELDEDAAAGADEASGSDTPLRVRPIDDFEAVVVRHRDDVRSDLRAQGEELDVAPPAPAPQERAPGERQPPRGEQAPTAPASGSPAGTTVATPPSTNTAPTPTTCGPRCQTAGGTTTPIKPPEGQTTRPPCAPTCPTPVRPPADTTTTKPPTGTAPAPSGTVPKPPAGTTCPSTGCLPLPGSTTTSPNTTAPVPGTTCPTGGCTTNTGTYPNSTGSPPVALQPPAGTTPHG